MKSVPPMLLGSALLFWGWRTDLFLLGAIAAFILEGANITQARWNFTDKEFNRIWDVCTILFLGAAAYFRFSEDVVNAAYKFFGWFPPIFLLMAVGSAYSTRDRVPLKAFSWFLRKKGSEGGEQGIAFDWVYLAICIVSAGAPNVRDIWFYLGVVFFSGWALWAIRPHRIPVPAWLGIFLVTAFLGFLAQGKMQDFQAYFEGKAAEFFARFGRRDFDPRESRTSMGQIGSLKQSSRIVLKVKSEFGGVPERLRQTTYYRYEDEVWRSRVSFEQLQIEADATTWTLLPFTNIDSAVRITERVPRQRAMLSVPLGTAQLRELVANGVETNSMGAVRAVENPSIIEYVALYDPARSSDLPPRRESDLRIPSVEEEAISTIARQLNLRGKPPEEKISALHAFFDQNFRYTTYQAARQLGLNAGTPLSDFLLNHRAGHCEYFATATVLLLREFKIPARYATGYAVQESSRDEEDTYIVRERHAHAWALAYVGGRWIEVDTTPAGWDAAEQEDFPAYQPIKDWFSSFSFGFLEWRWLGESTFIRTAAPWLLGPMVLFLVWRVFGRRMQKAFAPRKQPPVWPGLDSEFYLLERQLEKTGLTRQPFETAAAWGSRVQQTAPEISHPLSSILSLHYKYRFDPAGLDAREREQLRHLVQTCLGKL